MFGVISGGKHADNLHLSFDLILLLYIIDQHFLQIQPFCELCADTDPCFIVKFSVGHPNPPNDLDTVLEFVNQYKSLDDLFFGPI